MSRYVVQGLASDLLAGRTVLVLGQNRALGALYTALRAHLEAQLPDQGSATGVAAVGQREVRFGAGRCLFRSPIMGGGRGIWPDVVVVDPSIALNRDLADWLLPFHERGVEVVMP